MDLKDFPIIASQLTENQTIRFSKAIHIINTAIFENKIANPIFQDLKHTLNNIVDTSWRGFINDRFNYMFYSTGGNTPTEVIDAEIHLYGASSIPSTIKKVNKVKTECEVITEMKKILVELEMISNALSKLKLVVFKRQPKPVDERKEKFVPDASSTEAMKMVYNLMNEITLNHYETLLKLTTDYYVQELDNFIALDKLREPNTKMKRSDNPMITRMIDMCTTRESYHFNAKYNLKDNYMEILISLATREAKDIQDQFIYKNLRKLVSIIETKNSKCVKKEILGGEVSLAGLIGTIKFSFEDNSSFIVENSVVYSRSKYGKWFRRFPLTFHNVTLKDGNKMKQPSEERMNKIFCDD